MTTDHHFDKLVAAVTHALGPQTPLELRGEWPEDGGDNTPANTAEWRWQGHDVFVHAHDPLAHDEVAYDGYSDFTPESLAIDVEMLLSLAGQLATKVDG